MISPRKWFAKLPRSVATSAAIASAASVQTLEDRQDFQSMSAPGCGASVTCELVSRRRNPCCEEVSRAFAQLESLCATMCVVRSKLTPGMVTPSFG